MEEGTERMQESEDEKGCWEMPFSGHDMAVALTNSLCVSVSVSLSLPLDQDIELSAIFLQDHVCLHATMLSTMLMD